MITLDVRTLRDRVGEEIALGDWFPITQERIDQFADATGDHQWIHVDPARAATDTPFKSTIAHGFLTLSLVSTLVREAVQFTALRMAINYGLNRVRFVSPVPSGSRVRVRMVATRIRRGERRRPDYVGTDRRTRRRRQACVRRRMAGPLLSERLSDALSAAPERSTLDRLRRSTLGPGVPQGLQWELPAKPPE